MFVPFETLPDTARLWIFQGEKEFSQEELTIISSKLELLTSGWSAHGQPLRASFEIRENHFIVLAVDESFHQASGCSIDSSVHLIREIGNLIGQDLFKRDSASFKLGDNIQMVKISNLKTALKEGLWNENTLTFNTLVQTKAQLSNDWLIAAKDTWLKRYVAREKVTP